MKKVGDLMAELGFRPDGSESVKRAFIENLVRAAGGELRRPTSAPIAQAKPTPAKTQKTRAREEQLSFDFDNEADDPGVPFPLDQKRPAG